jgi:hypothetical protein
LLVSVTLAPTMAAPFESATLPLMVPRLVWARAANAPSAITAAVSRT